LPCSPLRPPPTASLFPYTTLFRSSRVFKLALAGLILGGISVGIAFRLARPALPHVVGATRLTNDGWRKYALVSDGVRLYFSERGDRESTRLNFGHGSRSYAVLCFQ